jgi:hypothetical protein
MLGGVNLRGGNGPRGVMYRADLQPRKLAQKELPPPSPCLPTMELQPELSRPAPYDVEPSHGYRHGGGDTTISYANQVVMGFVSPSCAGIGGIGVLLRLFPSKDTPAPMMSQLPSFPSSLASPLFDFTPHSQQLS